MGYLPVFPQAQSTGHVGQPPAQFDPAAGAWNMDKGASSHLNDSVTSLSDIFNMCIYPSVSVGDGHTIPVTNTGDRILPTPYIPLYLNNVLITPNIVKNLVSVRQFVWDNNCTVEFNAFGFSVKDFMTRRCFSNVIARGTFTRSHSPLQFLMHFLPISIRGTTDLDIHEVKCYVLEGIDVDETYILVVKLGTIRIVLSLATSRRWPIHQLDVKNAFLHGDLSKTINMHQPLGFQDFTQRDYICLLQRSLYAFKKGNGTAYLLLYVDDIVLTASSEILL
ncbi:ribonuclease H-like domain-containing protein [Tanacetum coccineum]